MRPVKTYIVSLCHQMILDEDKKIVQDQDNYKTMKKQRKCERSQLLKTSKKTPEIVCSTAHAGTHRLAVQIYPTM